MLPILRRAVYEEPYLGHNVNKKGIINKHDDVNKPPVDLRAVCLVRAMVEEVCGSGLTSANLKRIRLLWLRVEQSTRFLARDGARSGHASSCRDRV